MLIRWNRVASGARFWFLGLRGWYSWIVTITETVEGYFYGDVCGFVE